MKIRTLAACAVLAASSFAHAQLINDSFTYQGTLLDGGVPANGLYDISFIVYDAAVGGSIVFGGSQFVGGVEVIDGLFEAYVDFGLSGSVFDSDESRWLSIRVVPTAGGTPAVLSPRQRITPAPLANYALRSGTSLQDAYDNGKTIFRSLSDGPVNILAETGILARLNLGSAGGTDGAGRLYMYSEAGANMFNFEPDVSGGGGAFALFARNEIGTTGMFIDGNAQGSESTAVSIFGVDRNIFLTTSLPGDDSVRLPSDAINSTEIFNEAGVAENQSNTTIALTNVSATIDVVASVTIDCPAAGYVFVIATSELQVSHVTGSTSSINLGVSNSMTSIPGNGDVETFINSAAVSGQYDHAVTVHSVFSAVAGSNTFYLLGDKNNTTGSGIVLDSQLSAIYIPTAYGTAALNSGPANQDDFSQINAPMSELDVLREQDKSQRDNIARQQREIDAMKIQMQQLIEQTNRTLEEQAQD